MSYKFIGTIDCDVREYADNDFLNELGIIILENGDVFIECDG